MATSMLAAKAHSFGSGSVSPILLATQTIAQAFALTDRPQIGQGGSVSRNCCSLDAPYQSRRSITNLRFATQANRNSICSTAFRGQQAPSKGASRMITRQGYAGTSLFGGILV